MKQTEPVITHSRDTILGNAYWLRSGDNPLDKIEWAFAATECVRIASLALSIGTIAVVDISMLGLRLKNQTPAKLLRSAELLTMAGLTLVISSGPALFTTDPLRYLLQFHVQNKNVPSARRPRL